MDTVLTYRGRDVSPQDVAFIERLIAEHPEASRRRLSQLLCQAWGWAQANGALRDMVCRGLLLALHRGGWIELPPPRQRSLNPLAHRKPPAPIAIDQTPLAMPLRELGPLDFRLVRRTAQEPLFNALLAQHHYLGYTQPVGAHLKYLVFAQERPAAALAFSSAPRVLAPRDRFVGWSKEARLRGVHLIAYNPRFLIPSWVRVPHLASHVLGRIARRLSRDWQAAYGHPLYFLETFVDPTRFAGTCYRAANWLVLGRTQGRGHRAPRSERTRPIKEVWGYPLTPCFREQLGRGA